MKKLLTVLLLAVLFVLTTALADVDLTGNWYSFSTDSGVELMLILDKNGDYTIQTNNNWYSDRLKGKWHMKNGALWLDDDVELTVTANSLRDSNGYVFTREGLDLTKIAEDRTFRETNALYAKPWKAVYVHQDGTTGYYLAEKLNFYAEITLNRSWMDIRFHSYEQPIRLTAVRSPKNGTRQYVDSKGAMATVYSISAQNMLLLEIETTDGETLAYYMAQE